MTHANEARNDLAETAASGPRGKVRTIEELAAISAQVRQAGRKVVHAHGAFDLLHLGHVRHLEAATRFGDVLVVTITADEFVNKGPGRPVFKEHLRAEMLAALEYVDWVAINLSPDAVSAIEAIRPSVYVKGQDYQNPQGDVTGKITKEREAVEAVGGEIKFTDEVTFSSSALINRHLNVFEPHVREHLASMRDDGGLERLVALIESVRDYRVLVVGDAIIDEYQYVLPMGKSPKENMIATRYQDKELFAGGVFAAANHLAAFCRDVEVITVLGGDDHYEEFIKQNLHPNVRLKSFIRTGAPTTRKQRMVDPSYMRKLFEVYYMDDEPLTGMLQNDLDAAIEEIAPKADIVIVTDFGHGLVSRSTISTVVSKSKFLAVNTQSNSANLGYNLITKYPKADYICIDVPEARLAISDRASDVGNIAQTLVHNRIECPNIVITQGKHGCVTYQRGALVHTIPSFTHQVVDTVGAGDAFFAVTAPLVAAGAPLNEVGFIGNVVGAIKVGIVGHRRSIDRATLIKSITGLLK